MTIEPQKYSKEISIKPFGEVSYYKNIEDFLTLDIIIDTKSKDDISFYINFYTSFKEKPINSKVEKNNILCGRLKIVSKCEKKGVAIYISYDGYIVDTEIEYLGKRALGHAGILLIDTNGETLYYEYGRYDTTDGTRGRVRKVTIPNIKWDGKGIISEIELNKVLSFLSKKSGQNRNITAAYVETNHLDKMIQYAKEKYVESNPNAVDKIVKTKYSKDREPYKINSNNCATFAMDVIRADENISRFSMIRLMADNIVSEFIEENYKEIFYNSKTNTTTIK